MTLLDTVGGEQAGQPLGAGVQFTVRNPGVPGNQGCAPRLSARLCGEDVMQ
ncbi:hypothetical protein SBI_06054 [Streptomyces bingchenggensis BCW-1]|uniref:Uncharacterized protein n=1 Tax=Streptomyces bingchenggensis (strain BCW-1) TaxID=749414 RepID=D7CHX4_STRBB|nr:hypothetical protein SBI_06054 [Streptomyces bingchenggensis BCW-1]